jgi:ABC-type nickel/cobalt efflux system permease component RcnA
MDHLTGNSIALPFMFWLGMLHGLGPDHLAAVTALVARGGNTRSASYVGFKFGLGHMGVLGIVCGAALLCKFTIQPGFERTAEVFGGILLIAIGISMCRDLGGVQVYAHRHVHQHDGTVHEHVHLHVGDKDAPHQKQHGHPHMGTLFGGLFAFSGARAMLTTVAVVVAKLPSVPVLIAYILLFGAGIILTMSVYGAIVARFYKVAERHELVFRGATMMTMIATIGIGMYWIADRV